MNAIFRTSPWQVSNLVGAVESGALQLPDLLGKNEALATQLFTIHRWAGFLLIALVLAHILPTRILVWTGFEPQVPELIWP